MTTPATTGETRSYEGTNAALDAFSSTASAALSRAENLNVRVITTGELARAVQTLSSSLAAVGMTDAEMAGRVSKIGETANTIERIQSEMETLRLQLIEAASDLDTQSTGAKDWHVETHGKVAEVVSATQGAATDNTYYGAGA